jgi:GTP-binding protein YchF
VLRCFDDDNIVHVDGNVNPLRDKETIDFELILKDLESVEKKMQRFEKIAKVGSDKDGKRCYEVLSVYKTHLEAGNGARSAPVSDDDKKYIEDIFLLTNKPVMYVCNVDANSIKTGNKYVDAVKEAVKDENAEVLIITAATESEITQLETYEDRQAFLADLGLEESGVSKLIKQAYRLLKLQTYFTAGVKEVRAWTIHVGMTAPQAASVIHTDFEKGFIRAEVIHYNDFVTLGSESACRDAGKLAIEGKEYIVQDGDLMHFRFNV